MGDGMYSWRLGGDCQLCTISEGIYSPSELARRGGGETRLYEYASTDGVAKIYLLVGQFNS